MTVFLRTRRQAGMKQLAQAILLLVVLVFGRRPAARKSVSR
jgi:hypothetical protein